ncbi:MAG: flippase [Janthinobacterium lividum]
MSLRRNVLWNLAGTGLPLVAGAVLVPYLVRTAGIEVFGILTLVWALIGYFSLFDLGLGRAMTQQVARKLAAGRSDEVPSLVKSGLLVTAAMGAIGGLLLTLVAEPLAMNGLKVSAALHDDVFRALLVAAIGVPVTTATVGLRGVLEAYEDFRGVNLLRMMLGLANFGLPALSAYWFGPSLVPMVASLTVARALFGIAHWVIVRRRLGGGLGGVALQRRGIGVLLSFGAWMTVSNIISPLMVTADRFGISAVMGAAVVAYYTVPSEIVARILILPGALTGALFPRLTSLMTHDIAAAHRLYRRCVAVVACALVPLCTLIAVGAHWGISLWLGDDFADRSAPVAAILALGLLFNGIAYVPFAAVQAAGLARTTAQLHVAEAFVYFPVLWFALGRFGLAGAAAAWTLRVGIDLLMLQEVVRRHVFATRPSSTMRHNLASPEPERP